MAEYNDFIDFELVDDNIQVSKTLIKDVVYYESTEIIFDEEYDMSDLARYD